ncbi:MAG: hypothetical protein ACRDSZ_02085, partial [Pseudonocardiaceae bacterium]
LERAGQPEAARMELAAARDCFDHLGARLDAEAAAAQLAASTGSEVSSSLRLNLGSAWPLMFRDQLGGLRRTPGASLR